MTIPLGKGAEGAEFAFDSDQATVAGGKISALADGIRGLPQLAGAQSGIPSIGSDRVSKAVAEVVSSQNQVISAGSAHISGRLEIAAGHFTSSAKEIDETESSNAQSLTAHPATGA
ncbi:hypothetical protein [Segniliparus rugosus]|uniref:Uncharacterized protein n=1 Tax=Segniliparus rugosus (strain ATCC BAA-974 / DSM 45345 / CCUG 50838 / CIP 108380 / JCM 13579 / CDC 945) TaxID=679197 RepID=E5XLH9_SEGRC|nr:hypothetical protein [Segniliparus rugosus]EFV14793.1 hypothetical protein HMPREF9336_00348 [Segniliparus rugosus ATCC BAA-974]